MSSNTCSTSFSTIKEGQAKGKQEPLQQTVSSGMHSVSWWSYLTIQPQTTAVWDDFEKMLLARGKIIKVDVETSTKILWSLKTKQWENKFCYIHTLESIVIQMVNYNMENGLVS